MSKYDDWGVSAPRPVRGRRHDMLEKELERRDKINDKIRRQNIFDSKKRFRMMGEV
jgi:hypothetical protein